MIRFSIWSDIRFNNSLRFGLHSFKISLQIGWSLLMVGLMNMLSNGRFFFNLKMSALIISTFGFGKSWLKVVWSQFNLVYKQALVFLSIAITKSKYFVNWTVFSPFPQPYSANVVIYSFILEAMYLEVNSGNLVFRIYSVSFFCSKSLDFFKSEFCIFFDCKSIWVILANIDSPL